ncbi:ATP-binding cassette, subfamily C (CFTR/MRP), member 2 [Marchantia polymorpha subsp. ruderalis]|uniref:Uncharacterized protein n=2 Tax=Marchantia polymorpha TaxID=3197 RepID=A0AAF6B8Z9_MARPO|nr:hypothetical protein MARPO_0011s0180 [Marchantia polymorpha]BBN08483.1 hypothetical protein Mp_4g11950 [Marchantia polymorpha subsp. ruderalis]|eukprot:PTQ46520.1 hypothetical protein MARPO_0011s0180 [Marchantia polymorpha]
MWLVDQLNFWTDDGLGTWGKYCQSSIGDCEDLSCLENQRYSQDHQPKLFGSCGIHSFTSVVHLLFLVAWLVGLLWRVRGWYSCSGEKQERRLKQRNNEDFTCPRSPVLLWSIVGCFLLSLQNIVLAVYGIVQAQRGKYWPVHAEVTEFIQVLVWALLGAITYSSWNQKEKYSPMVRAWWIVGFVLSLATLLPNFVVAEPWDIWMAVIETSMIPIGALLFVVAGRGLSETVKVTDSLKESLLDEEEKEELPAEGPGVTPYATAGIFSLASVSWISPLMAKGAKKPLQLSDVPLPAPGDQASFHYARFKENWDMEMKTRDQKSPSFYKAIARTFWRKALWNAIIAGANSVASYVGPFLIEDFVEYLAGRRRFPQEGAILVSLFFLSKVVEILAQRQWFLGMQFLGLNFKSAMTAFVYHKGLVLSNQARQGHTSGEIINYVTVDVERIGDFAWFFQDIWILPLQILLALLVLYKVVGIAAIAALAASILTVALNMPLTTWQDHFQDKLMEAKDRRMKSLTESLRSMRILKLQGWENRYLSKLERLRDVEYGWLKGTVYVNAGITFLFWTAPIIVSVATFGTCALTGMALTSGKILTALAVFITMSDPLVQIPELFSMISQTRVSVDRLQTYLLQEELQKDAVKRVDPSVEGNIAIDVKGADFSWDPLSRNPTLQDIDFQAKKGQRVAVCGTVGSGKSSILSCLLGEIPKVTGSVTIAGTTAYVAQSSWIQSGTIEENILFGSPMNRMRYEETVRICSLEKDIELFAYGDQTEIGERGINMSGGQKQRIQLARAVYLNADIYLLDDPFSAVDAHTGSDLFKNCILGALSGKTVIYVTHQVEFLSAADLILVIRDGKIVQAGSYNELLQGGADLNALVNAHNEAIEFMTASVYKKEEEVAIVEALSSEVVATGDSSRVPVTRIDSMKEIMPELEKKQLVEDEETQTGRVSLSVYWNYFTSVYKGAFIPVILLAQICFQVLQIASNYWMAWSTPAAVDEAPKVDNETLILVYCAFAFGSCLFVSIRALLASTFGLLAANKSFKDMIRSVYHAPMSFFDSTPNGRILSRASSDQNALDSQLMFTLTGVMISAIQIIGIVAVMSQVTFLVLAVLVPVSVACLWLQQYYVNSSRELQRMVGVLKAPIIHHYAESIAGTATIRGFQQEQRFLERNFFLYDQYARAFFHNFSAIQWLMFRMESLSTVVFTFCLIYIVVFPIALDPGMAGLAVTYGLQLNGIISWWIWNFCRLENRIISVERIKQFTDLEREAPYVIEDSRPPTNWPSEGVIDLRNLQVRYNDHSPLVLHGLTCRIEGGQKIGVVGRTGSGKSTLIQALFRLVEPAGGKIIIDGIDITSIGLHDLRSKLSVIPQDPTLFEGTMRVNLDPLEQYSDAEIWEALDKCQLGDIVRAKDTKLDFPVSENGENWSVGQRQLLCLGRALLKRSQILVLDEATASVDSRTDGLIQRTIRAEFGKCTVITVAHRIPSVADSDRVLVLSDGKVAEYDAPSQLLQNKSSFFYKLVSEYSARSNSVADLSK